MTKVFTFLFIIFSLNVSAQSGITWNMGMNVASSSSGNDHPRIATDAAGNPLVIWGHSNRLRFSRWNGTAFTAPVMLNPSSITIAEASWMGPDIASKGDTIYVVYKQTPEASDTCHIFCLRSFNGGISFASPVRVDYISTNLSRFPTVAIDSTGNPIIAFMKFNSSFGNAQWVVTRSANYGSTFSADVLASGWSSGTSTVCDCCPGSIVSSGNLSAVVYRDNKNDIRDSWAGISTNNGISFDTGFAVDKNNWYVNFCPASGPHAVIKSDTLYSVFMNGAGGRNKNYLSKSSISSANTNSVVGLTGNFSGLTQQNFPRIAQDGKALAIVWTQTVFGNSQLPLLFTNDIAKGFPMNYDTIDLNDITNADVIINNGKIYVVWEDDNSGTVKFRSGSFTKITSSVEEISESNFSVYPNPVSDFLNIEFLSDETSKIIVTNLLGQQIFSQKIYPSQKNIRLNVAEWKEGIYFITIQNSDRFYSQKTLVQH